MPYTLIVVDMQREFHASRKRSTIQNCKFIISSAIEDEADIIFLEYIGCGRTIKSLSDLADKYEMMHIIRKNDCSGAAEINAVKVAYGLQTQHFKVCGVNTDQCVQFTVINLSELFPEAVVEVIARACNASSKEEHQDGLDIMEGYDNVIINNKPSL